MKMVESARLEMLENVRRTIENAYHERVDYPPFRLISFDDRAVYHQYIIKLIYELIDFEKGESKRADEK